MTTFRKTLLLGGSFYVQESNAWGQPLLLLHMGSPDPPSFWVLPAKSYTRGTVLSIGDPGMGACHHIF